MDKFNFGSTKKLFTATVAVEKISVSAKKTTPSVFRIMTAAHLTTARILTTACLIVTACILTTSCASTEADRNPASFGGSNPSNAHPASYITDTFRVNRPLPPHKASVDTPFYFKKCTEAGSNWPQSNTKYDCDYP